MNRRNFLACSSSCAAWMAGIAQFAPTAFRAAMQQSDESREILFTEKWGRVEKVEEGVWALVSTAFETKDFTTVCNGGIIAGDKGVLAVESFMQPKGAKWWAEIAEQLTGRWPTDIVATHFHGDHTAGHSGYFSEKHKPNVWLTDSTKDAAEKSFGQRGMKDSDFKNVQSIHAVDGAEIDLGNRKVSIKPRSGHTDSDVTIELADPSIIWSGDLFFNRIFPNFSNATPSQLNRYSADISAQKETVFIPGHGPIADSDAAKKYHDFLAWVENWARESIKTGDTAAKAGKEFKLPKEFQNWLVWSPQNAQLAWTAWDKEIKAAAEADKKAKQE